MSVMTIDHMKDEDLISINLKQNDDNFLVMVYGNA